MKTIRKVCTESLQSFLTLCDPMDCSPPGSSVHGILQARILEWVAMPSSRGSCQPRDRTCVCYVTCIGRWVLYHLGSPIRTVTRTHIHGFPSVLVSPFLQGEWKVGSPEGDQASGRGRYTFYSYQGRQAFSLVILAFVFV